VSFLEPVEIVLERHHAYESKGPRGRGCAVCNEAKTHPDHLGAPPSLQILGSGNEFVYQNHKKAWQQLLAERLEASGLSRGLAHVLVEGECTFPDRRKRDQGNHRFMLEKALGDALVSGSPSPGRDGRELGPPVVGGWLADDTWEQYEFGGLASRYEKGVSRTRLLVFATVAGESPQMGMAA
jgi:hypothetical protein